MASKGQVSVSEHILSFPIWPRTVLRLCSASLGFSCLQRPSSARQTAAPAMEGWGLGLGVRDEDAERGRIVLSDRLLEGYHESRRCSRDTYLGSYITRYTSIGRKKKAAGVRTENKRQRGGRAQSSTLGSNPPLRSTALDCARLCVL